jgi:hypothetical protein
MSAIYLIRIDPSFGLDIQKVEMKDSLYAIA